MSRERTLADFLALPWSDTVRAKLQEAAKSRNVEALVAKKVDGRLVAAAFQVNPRRLPKSSVAVWRRNPLPKATVSLTRQAVNLVTVEGITPHEAAVRLGINASAVYRALTRVQQKPICPCCGQVVREGFTVKSPSAGPAGS